ncbi:MAG: ABC transporter ATP-binding protein [Thaumarchaeota archaeon]|nr:ABC transporter ATP-binding protein [Nitrososphaerota archaeon]
MPRSLPGRNYSHKEACLQGWKELKDYGQKLTAEIVFMRTYNRSDRTPYKERIPDSENKLPVSISTNMLTKDFASVRALNGVTTNIEKGEIRGLLGPNGSGKSTFMKILMGLIKPDYGLATVEGLDPSKDPIAVRQRVGYVPETPRLYDFLTGLEYLDFVADLYGLPPQIKKERIDEFMTAFELTTQGNDLLSGYSQGMRQKIAFSAALMHRPQVLILDEALNGLDPRSAKIIKDTLVKLASEGVTVLFSTHVLEIAQVICQRVTILDKGNILAEGTLEGLRSMTGSSATNLENIFLSLTGSSDVRAVVEALTSK